MQQEFHIYQIAKASGPAAEAWIDVTKDVYDDAEFYSADFKRRLLYVNPQEPAVPQGWKLVPVEPTSEMLSAVRKEMGWCNPVGIFSKMLAATPAAPSQEPVTLTEDEIDANTVWFDPDPHDNVHCDVHATVNKCIAALREKQAKVTP